MLLCAHRYTLTCIHQDTTYTDTLLGEERRGVRGVIRENEITKLKQIPITPLIVKRRSQEDKLNKNFGTTVSWGPRLGLLGEVARIATLALLFFSQTSEILVFLGGRGGKKGGRDLQYCVGDGLLKF